MTARRPRVSVVTIFLDEERFLAEAIASVRAQTMTDWELLLVDDGSRDRSSDIARDAAASDAARVRYLQHAGGTNRGMSASRNLGLAHARGEHIAFLDADDVWLAGKLEEQLACFDAEPRVGLVYGRTTIWHSWNRNTAAADFHYPLGVAPNRVYEPPRLFNQLMRNRAQTPTTCNALVRRALVDEVGGFVEAFTGMFEDQVFFAKALLAAPVWVDERTWAKYRVHPASCSERALGSADELRTRLRFLAWVGEHLATRSGAPVSARAARLRAVLATRRRLLRRRARAALRGVSS
jgi:glycosyltransferase involved in cell wall biosynthesis